MRAARLLGTITATCAAIALTTGSASALGTGRAVFVQNDSPIGNAVLAYDRANDGTLIQVGAYPTGGLGGALEGSVVDHLASQSSLVYDGSDGLLYAVNAGSDTISVFAVFGDRLALRQVLASGGSFPVSIAAAEGLVYVLNAGEGGVVAGFRVAGGRLSAIPGSARALGLDASATPQFVNTPGQVAFSADARQLLVTTKANTNAVDAFAVGPAGRLSQSPRVNSLPGTVPFALTFDRQGHVVLTEAGPNDVAVFELREDGELLQLDAVPTGQAATCWVVGAGDRFYVSNAGSASLSGYRSQAGGQLLTALGNTATDPGTVDAAVPPGGRFLYVQAGGPGAVDEYAIESGGALAKIGSVTVPGAQGGEGIVAP
jgi:6-phosphogluconolactonase (cycloisomerase 2 family)